MAGTGRLDGLVYDRPNMLAELQVFHVLGNIVETADQAQRILQCGDHCPAQGGGRSEPFLLADLNHDPVRDFLNCDGQCGLASGGSARAGTDLDGQIICLAKDLCAQITPIELCQQGLRQVRRI